MKPPRRRILFVCLGNACRSQMAEGFARAYGGDIVEPSSAGLAPLRSIPLETIQTMAERSVDIGGQFPKPFADSGFDLIINMSGFALPRGGGSHIRIWEVEDPFGESPEVYRRVRDRLEQLVRDLLAELRRRPGRGLASPAPIS